MLSVQMELLQKSQVEMGLLERKLKYLVVIKGKMVFFNIL